MYLSLELYFYKKEHFLDTIPVTYQQKFLIITFYHEIFKNPCIFLLNRKTSISNCFVHNIYQQKLLKFVKNS